MKKETLLNNAKATAKEGGLLDTFFVTTSDACEVLSKSKSEAIARRQKNNSAEWLLFFVNADGGVSFV